MNAEEIQYALDRRNQVDLPLSDPDTDNIIDKPIQLGHLTGDVIIESSQWANINYLGPPGRAVFEYSYTGVQTPPRIFFKNIVARNTGTGTYAKQHMAFFRVIQPNTSPKAIFAEHCDLAGNIAYLFDGPDVCGCDGIQIKHCTAGGSAFMRWRLRDGETMLFLELNNTRHQTSEKVGPSTDFKNTRGISFNVFTDEQNADVYSELLSNYAGPLSHRFVNPKGFNKFQHNWNEYATNWDTEATGCWGTSIRVDDTSGNYGMHFLRGYQTSFRGGTSTGVEGVQVVGGHDSANAGSLYVEALNAFNLQSGNDERLFAGKCFPKLIDAWDIDASIASQYTDLNSDGLVSRLSVYDEDGQPRITGNTRTIYYNTEYRLDRDDPEQDYEDVLFAVAQSAYGDMASTTAVDGSDIVITFTQSGDLTVVEEVQVEYLIAGGGGSGGARPPEDSQNGGGGGAGGFASNFGGTKVTLSPGTYPVVVGAGGIFTWGSYGQGTDGGSSSFNGITVPGGGGGGGSSDGVTYTNGRDGGCGGGAAGVAGLTGGVGSAYGYAGGSASGTGGTGASGASGGGGAGSVGVDGVVSGSVTGGDGGAGVASSITGTSVTYCEGGGGSSSSGGYGDGGTEGGGWPRTLGTTSTERDGKKNLGGGGAGGAVYTVTPSAIHYPGNGGNGVVIIRVTGA